MWYIFSNSFIMITIWISWRMKTFFHPWIPWNIHHHHNASRSHGKIVLKSAFSIEDHHNWVFKAIDQILISDEVIGFVGTCHPSFGLINIGFFQVDFWLRSVEVCLLRVFQNWDHLAEISRLLNKWILHKKW